MNVNVLAIDELPDGFLLYFIIFLSMVGGFDIITEILNEHKDFFSKNLIKKMILWSIIYLKTKSIYKASLISIVVVLLLPRIFFGKPTSPRIKT